MTTASPSEAHRTGGARHRPPEGLKTEATSRRAQMQDGRAVHPPPNVRTSRNPGGVRTSRRRDAASASTGPSGSTPTARTVLARWSVPSSGHGVMVWSADPSNRSGQSCQSQTRVSVSEPLVRRPHGGAGAPADLALRTCALGRHSWLPTHRRPVASAHSPCLSRPPERMWTDAACPRPDPLRSSSHPGPGSFT